MTVPTNPISCATLEKLKAHAGKRVAVTGTYIAIDLRMRQKGAPATFGHAAVQLCDDTEVLLEPSWSPSARRSEAERSRFAGKRVEVIGSICLEPPKPTQPVAYVVAPCISPVEQISLAPGASG
jgi:hypothetical protein